MLRLRRAVPLPADAAGQVEELEAVQVPFPFQGDQTAQQPKFAVVGRGFPVGQKTQLPEMVVHIVLPAIDAPEGLALAVGVLPLLGPEIDPGAEKSIKTGGFHDDGLGGMKVARTALGRRIKQRPHPVFLRPIALGIDFVGIAAEHEIAVGLIPGAGAAIGGVVVEPPAYGKAGLICFLAVIVKREIIAQSEVFALAPDHERPRCVPLVIVTFFLVIMVEKRIQDALAVIGLGGLSGIKGQHRLDGAGIIGVQPQLLIVIDGPENIMFFRLAGGNDFAVKRPEGEGVFAAGGVSPPEVRPP
jgi:hypothetical protein